MAKPFDPNEFSGDAPPAVEVQSNSGVTAFDPSEFSGEEKKKVTQKKPSEGKSIKDQALDIASGGTALLDVLGGGAGFIAGLGTGVLDVAAGHLTGDPKKAGSTMKGALEKAGRWSEATMPSTYSDELKAQRERGGYQGVMKPVEALTQLFHGANTGVQAGAEALGVGPEKASELGAGTETALALGLPFARRAPARPGSPRQYQQIYDGQGGRMSQRDIERTRETYPPEEPVKPWDAAEFSEPVAEGFAPEYRPDVFTGPEEAIMTEPQRGFRESTPGPDLEVKGMRGEEGYFGPEMTEYGYTETQGPRAPIPDNSVEFKQYQADRVVEQMEASEKPGFLRSAEEVMRARELEKSDAGTTVTHQKPQNHGEAAARFEDTNFRAFENEVLADKMFKAVEDFRKGVDSNPTRVGLETIRETSSTPFYKELAKKILEDENFKPDTRITDGLTNASGKEIAGLYSSANHRIALDIASAGNEQVLLHEAMHARTYSALQAYITRDVAPGTWRQMQHLEAPVKRIVDLFESLKESQSSFNKDSRLAWKNREVKWRDVVKNPLTQTSRSYGMTDVHEFVAEGFTNPAFQSQLAQLRLPDRLRQHGWRNYWDAFVGSVARLFGFKPGRETYLSELIRAGSELMSKTGKNERIYYADMLNPNKDLGFGGRVKKDPVATAQETAREMSLDSRPIEEVIQKDLVGKRLEDFTAETSSLLYKSMMRLGSLVKENLLQDTSLRQIMKDKSGTGPLIKWTVDQVSRIERAGLIKTRDALDTALKPFRQMYRGSAASRAELRQAVDTWFQNIGERDLSRADFRTDRQWEIYKNFQGVQDRILDEINGMREKAGLKPIARIPSYFHAAWEGDYRVFGYKGDGTKVWARGYKTEWEAKRDVAALRKKLPDVSFGDPVHVARDKYSLDLGAFEDAIRTLEQNEPVTAAIQKVYVDILQHRGFGRTGVHKKGVLGFMGMEEGRMGLKMMDKAFDNYVNQAYRYIGNLEKQLVYRDLQKIPLDIRKQLPETFDFLRSYVGKTQGAKVDTMAIDKILSQMTQALGVGAGSPLRAIRGGSALASMYWLTTPRFLFSQSVQSMNAIPKLLQQFGAVDGTKAYFQGLAGIVSPDAITKEGTKWAGDRGYLDATIVNVLSGEHPIHGRPLGTKSLGPIDIPSAQSVKQLTSYPAAMIEHHLVRLPTFIAFEKALRPYIKDKTQRFQEAAEKTDYYMVNYSRAHSPMIYDKLGLAGEAARPLKQYAHNTWGQFFEYAKGVKDRGEITPLAAFLGVQASVAGLKGMMLVAEATVIVNLLNAMFDLEIPTPEQLLLKSGWHDAFIYGGLSTALGQDISSSVAAPGLPQMFSFPAIDFSYKAVTDVGNFVAKLIKGTDTDQDRLRAAMALTPNVMHEWLKSVYTKPGGTTANPGDKDLRGNYRRDESEWFWSIFLGTKPLGEAKIDAIMRSAKQEIRRDLNQRINALDAIVDRAINGQEINEKLIERYITEGGDPRRLGANIARRIKERELTGPERIEDAKTMSPSQANRIETLREYLDKNYPDRGQYDSESGAILKPRSDWKDATVKLASLETTAGETPFKEPTPEEANLLDMMRKELGRKPDSDGYDRLWSAHRNKRSLNDTTPPPSWHRGLPHGNEDQNADADINATIRNPKLKQRSESEFRTPNLDALKWMRRIESQRPKPKRM